MRWSEDERLCLQSTRAPARGGPSRADTPCTAVIRPNAEGSRDTPRMLTSSGEVAAIHKPDKAKES